MSENPKNIIVRMPNWVGDLVMATPILTDLKKRFPDAEITAMCSRPISELLEKDRDIDELFSFSKRPEKFSRRVEKKNIIEKLRTGKYDLGVLLTNSFSSAWWFWQGKIPERLGFKDHFRSFLLTKGISLPEKEQHQVLTYKELLKPLGIEDSSTMPRLYLEEGEIQNAKELLMQRGFREGKKLIGIHPGASYGSAKCWPPERYREVAQKLLEDENLSVVFFGDAKSLSLIKEIANGLGERAINLAGVTSLRELACIIKECDVLLTNDSGPMHIAAALGTDLVALFGSTSDVKTGPYGKGTVINKKVSCSPCFKRTCPIDFRCMKTIEVPEVLKLIREKIHVSHA